jgi:hypothetical protein
MGHRVPSCEGTSSAKAMPAALNVWMSRRTHSGATLERSNRRAGYRCKLLVLDEIQAADTVRAPLDRRRLRPRQPEEVFLVYRVEHGDGRALDDLVFQRRDAQRPLLPPGFGMNRRLQAPHFDDQCASGRCASRAPMVAI